MRTKIKRVYLCRCPQCEKWHYIVSEKVFKRYSFIKATCDNNHPGCEEVTQLQIQGDGPLRELPE